MDKENKTEKKVKTNAEKIWEEIKDMNVNMFTLPNQKVSDYCSCVSIEPTKAYLEYTVPAFLPSLEAALGSSYKLDKAGRWLTVSYVEVGKE